MNKIVPAAWAPEYILCSTTSARAKLIIATSSQLRMARRAVIPTATTRAWDDILYIIIALCDHRATTCFSIVSMLAMLRWIEADISLG